MTIKGDIFPEFMDTANIEAAATVFYVNNTSAKNSTVSDPFSTALTTTTNTSKTILPIHKPTTAAAPVVITSNPAAPNSRIIMRSLRLRY